MNGRTSNKTMDRADLDGDEASAIVDELNVLIEELRARNLRVSSWYGRFDLTGDPRSFEWINRGYEYRGVDGAADDRRFPWFLYWEIVWVMLNNEFKRGDRVLDLGGSSSLFSYYLAHIGCDVTAIDLQRDLVNNGNAVSKQMGWRLKNHVMDMRLMALDSKFDHITSLCVYEHIPIDDRVAVNRGVRDLLVEGGTFSITFDYRNPCTSAQLSTPRDVYEQFVVPSGLQVRGNTDFYDNNRNYLLQPFFSSRRLWMCKAISVAKGHFGLREFFSTKDCNDYTFGALFLEKGRE